MQNISWKQASVAVLWAMGLAFVSVGRPLEAAPLGATPAPAPVPSLETLFRAESYRGQNAKDMAFSKSGRYLGALQKTENKAR
ncbi:hypothetical protein ACG0Z6_03445 [Roseateles sp. BYS180W]|uniref:Uncharacterized protein n=1 Tax=Roseateles rivi TaxID=3299028 RepID=A0ABW7FSI5_9BURK